MDWLNRGIDEEWLRTQFDRGFEPFCERFGDRHPALVRAAEQLNRLIPRLPLSGFERTKGYTLTHGDLILDNVFFPTAAGGRFAFIDWQFAGVSPPTGDVTGWILWNLSIEQRRLWEDELLDLYVDTLKDHGISNYGRRQLRREHRGTILVMLGIGIGTTARLPVLSESEREKYDARMEQVEAAFCDWKAHRLMRLVSALLRLRWLWQLLSFRRRVNSV